jgi:hypothetical protein
MERQVSRYLSSRVGSWLRDTRGEGGGAHGGE